MSLIEKIRAKAQADVKTIVLPEGDEKRTVKAAEIIKKEGLAEPVLIGSPDAVAKVAAEQGADISGIKVIDPAASEKSDEYAQALFELRKAKGVTEDTRSLFTAICIRKWIQCSPTILRWGYTSMPGNMTSCDLIPHTSINA